LVGSALKVINPNYPVAGLYGVAGEGSANETCGSGYYHRFKPVLHTGFSAFLQRLKVF
jgi:hypothetical protein